MKLVNISGLRIKKARIQAKLEHVNLAETLEEVYGLKLNELDIKEIEHLEREVYDYELVCISKILNVSPLWLLRGDENG